MKHGGRVLVICWALLSLLLSGCDGGGGYSSEYVEDLQRQISRLEEKNGELAGKIEDLYSELANDIEDARLGLLDADEMLRYLEDANGSYDARQIADGPYRQAVDALSDLYMKYVG